MTTEADLLSARDQARDLATARPTNKNRSAFKLAQKNLENYYKKLISPKEDHLVGIPNVCRYLLERGYEVPKNTAYDHKYKGKLKVTGEDIYLISDVEDYILNHLQSVGVGESQANLKQRAEIRRINVDADMRELKYKAAAGEYIQRSQVEIELAERAVHLKGYLDAVARSSAGKIIKLVKGDPQKAQELISFLLGVNRKAFDNYSRPIQGLEEEEE